MLLKCAQYETRTTSTPIQSQKIRFGLYTAFATSLQDLSHFDTFADSKKTQLLFEVSTKSQKICSNQYHDEWKCGNDLIVLYPGRKWGRCRRTPAFQNYLQFWSGVIWQIQNLDFICDKKYVPDCVESMRISISEICWLFILSKMWI